MFRPRFPNNRRTTPLVRTLALALAAGSMLAVLLVTNPVTQPDVAAILGAEPMATSGRLMMDDVTLSGNSTAAPSSRASQATPSASTPTTAASTPVSPPALRPTDVPSTVAPETVVPPTSVPRTSGSPTSEPIVPTEVPETFAATTRLVIPSIGVDAPVEMKSVGSDGVMQTPGAPGVVSWYDFSSPPAGGGNAVFAGHLDYAGYGPAVFWRLGELQAGDVIEVYQQDGTIVRYHVTSVRPFAATDDAREVIGSTGRPTITLITCEGAFDAQAREYNQRLVVTGNRID